jgi:TonB-linked SusC/RagA family outer membrane protein
MKKKWFLQDYRYLFACSGKIFKIMRLSVFFIVLTSLQALAVKNYAQSQKMGLKVEKATIAEVLNQIEDESDYFFFYNNKTVSLDKVVSLDLKDMTITQILDILFKGSDIDYTINNRQIILSGKSPVVTGTQQYKTVTGKVTDSFGQPLPGVSIVIRGTTNGTITGLDGNYSLPNVRADVTLVFSFVGMKSLEVPVLSKTVIDVALEEEKLNIDEVVVIGYGTAKRRDIVGAVEQVSSDILENRSNMNVVRSLQGQVSGVNVALWDGKPTRSTTPVIRGTTFNHGTSNSNSIGAGGSALVLIDGAEGDMGTLNPADIESISVLKDASSAAVYGARGAFGVILITTKKARKGEATVVYNGSVSIKSRTVIPERVTNGYEWTKMYLKSWQIYNNRTSYPTMIDNVFRFSKDWFDELERRNADPSLEKFRINSNGRYEYFGNTDWYEYFFKDFNYTNEHNISVSGGSDNANYYVSGRFFDQDGIYKVGNENFRQYNIRAKGSIKINSKLVLDHNMDYTVRDFHQPMVQYNNYLVQRMISRQGFPVTLPKNPDGTWTEAATYIGYAGFAEGTSYQQDNIYDSKTSTALTYTPIKDVLQIKADFTYAYTRKKMIRTTGLYQYYNSPTLTGHHETYSYLKHWNYDTDYLSGNIVGTFSPRLGDNHSLKIMAGWNIEDETYKTQHTYRQGLLYNSIPSFTLMDGEVIATESGGNTWGVVGVFGRINYNYRGKYLIEVSGRYDGSSKFPVNQQWGLFPSTSLGWRISEEGFMAGTKNWLDNFKVRASVGSLGNGAVSPYQFISSMSIGNTSYLVNGARQSYTKAPALVPSGLTWEKATTYNVGIDIDMFQNRLNFVFDRYQRNTTDMYTVGPSLPEVLGSAAPKGNNADLETKGWELSIGWKDGFNLGSKVFNYSVKGIIWDSQSWITKYYNTKGLLTSFYEGQRLGDIWGFRVAGLFESREEIDSWANQSFFTISNSAIGDNNNHLLPGDLKFKDLNDDERINYGDRTLDNHGDWEIIGNETPRYNYGINLNANWNGIGLSMFWQGVGKRDWYPGRESALFWGQYGRSYESALKSHTGNNVYSDENPDVNAYWPLYRGYQAQRELGTMSQANDRYLQNIAYLRLKNVTIDYTIPQRITNKLHLDNLKIYLTGENLLTFTPLHKITKNFDPENINSGDSDWNSTYGSDTAGDGYGYPILKSWTLGINVVF